MPTASKYWRVGLTITFVVIVGYWGSWEAFFQQDEWAGLGAFYALRGSLSEQAIALYSPIFKLGLAHFLPWVPAVNFVRYSLFGIDYRLYALFSIALHVTVSYAVFKLSLLFVKNQKVALLTSILFALSASSSQAVNWVGTSVPTQFATLFSLLSIIAVVGERESKFMRAPYVAFIFAVLALGFKETSLFLLILIPYTIYLRYKNKNLILKASLVGGVLYLLFRIVVLSFAGGVNKAISSSIFLFRKAIENSVNVLLKGLFQVAAPSDLVLAVRGDWVSDKLLGYLSVFFGLVIFLALLTIWHKRRKDKNFNILLAFLIFSFSPLAFLPNGELDAPFLASRGLYIPVAAFVTLLGYCFYNLRQGLLKKIVGIGIIVMLIVNLYTLRRQVSGLVEVGSLRRQILANIKHFYPDLPDKAVFYFKSDRSYYGLPSGMNIPPFQSGFGQTLLVWYQPTEGFEREFLSDKFLWEIESQGYMEHGSRGFGYFREYEVLREEVEKNNLSGQQIIAFEWSSKEEMLRDITRETRAMFENE